MHNTIKSGLERVAQKELIQVLNGEVDLLEAVKHELVRRGLDANGEYVGYIQSHNIHFKSADQK